MHAKKTTGAMRSLLDRLLSAFKPHKPRSRQRPGSAPNSRRNCNRRPRAKEQRTEHNGEDSQSTESASSDSDSDCDSDPVSSGYSRPIGYVDDAVYEANHYRSRHTDDHQYTASDVEGSQREYKQRVNHHFNSAVEEDDNDRANAPTLKTVASSLEHRRPSSDAAINSRNEGESGDSSNAGDNDDDRSEISIEEWEDPDEYAKRMMAKEKGKEKRPTKPSVPKRPNEKNGAPSANSSAEDKIEEPTMPDTPETSDKPDTGGSDSSETPL
ncbi:hypothetical protein V8F33_013267 [Rhypophila sp. PSN 637]